jgi:DNA-binding transcriptional regulator LsrR (DeoR family)
MASSGSNGSDRQLMSKVSYLYYLRELKQRQIADRLGLSRPKVSRLLKQAREAGIVQISVQVPEDNYVELESELEQRFGLEKVVITSSGGAPGTADNDILLKNKIGAAAASYLRRTVKDGDVLGVTWGTTLQAMMRSLHPVEASDAHVVQTLGGVGPPEAEAHAAELSRRLAQRLGARLTTIPAPGIVERPEVKDVLFSDRHIQAAWERFPDITTAYVGIGALDTNPIFEDDPNVSQQDYDALSAKGAVGDIALRFFNADGKPVETPFNNRLIGITLEQLTQADRVVGVAGGPRKHDAIRGALRGGLVDVLVTNRGVATQLVEHAPVAEQLDR